MSDWREEADRQLARAEFWLRIAIAFFGLSAVCALVNVLIQMGIMP